MLKISDIAKHAGVSVTTVSFVLNDRHEALRISEKTKIRVLEAAEELGYRSNQWARAMRTGDTRMLGLLGGNAAEEQVGRMLYGALDAADAQGYTLKILCMNAFGGNVQQIIRRSSELRLMGIIALHLSVDVLEELYTEAHEHDTPLVLMDGRCDNCAIPQVLSDDTSGIALGVEHLVQLGHSKIAFICGEEKSGVTTERKVAFQKAMARHNLPIMPGYVQDGHFSWRQPSVEAARRLLCLPPAQRPTAIFCSGDMIALATLQVAGDFQLNVPRDVSVVGFADLRVSEFAAPQLTTINQPFEEIGRTAVETLLAIVSERHSESSQATSTPQVENIKVLPTRLVPRASTALLKN
jgi:LacI family transcriptional regulator